MPNVEEYINLEIINDKQLQKLFTELVPAVQNRIVLNGMREAAKVILQAAKSNFKSSQKNKSKTGYKNLAKSFTTEPMKSTFGLRVGIKNYKLRWIEWGAGKDSGPEGEGRYYKKGKSRFFRYRKSLIKNDQNRHFTGKISPTNFFYNAVASTRTQAENNVSAAIIASLEKTVAKYESNNK